MLYAFFIFYAAYPAHFMFTNRLGEEHTLKTSLSG